MVSYIDGGKIGTGILEENLDVHYPYTLSSILQGKCTKNHVMIMIFGAAIY